MTVASTMIDAGAIDYALIVAGEALPVAPHRGAHPEPIPTCEDVLAQFAVSPFGSGAAAAVIGRADRHPEGHRIALFGARALSTVTRASAARRDQGMNMTPRPTGYA